MRVGVLARADAAEAWRVAKHRFPEDRKGQVTHQFAMKTTDSAWHHQLAARSDSSGSEGDPYWLVPFQNYKTFCPYLVGSYEQVANEIGRYLSLGYRTFILDIPWDAEDLQHIRTAFDQAIAGRPAAGVE